MDNRFSRHAIVSALLALFSLLAIIGCKQTVDELTPVTVAYNGNGNDSGQPPVDAHTYQKGDAVVVLAQGSLVKAGYDFAGWATVGSATSAAYAPGAVFQMPSNAVTLFAVWTPKAPPTGGTPTGGTQTGGTPTGETGGTPPTSSFTVTFSVDGGSNVASQTVGDGQKVSRPADPAMSGYTFGGWYRDQAVSSAWNFDSDTVSASITLYAKWNAVAPVTQKFTVTYNANYGDSGSVPVDTAEYEPGSMAPILGPGTLARTGCKFLGWSTSTWYDAWIYTIEKTIKVTKNVTFYARWKEIVYCKVSYHSCEDYSGHVPVDTTTYTEGDTITLSMGNDLYMDGCRLVGWVGEKDRTTYKRGETITCGSKDISLWADWRVLHRVEYVTHGSRGNVITTDKQRYVEGESVTIRTPSTGDFRSGYEESFLGWSTREDAYTVDYKAGSTISMPDEDLMLYPVWHD